MASSDARVNEGFSDWEGRGYNDFVPGKVEVVIHHAEGTTSGNHQSDATQSNDFNIAQGVLAVVFVCTICVAYYLGLMVANRVSVALTPIPLIVIVNVLYFAINAIKKCGFAPERCDDLTKLVEAVGLVGNFFKPRPVFLPSAQALLKNAASVSSASFRA